MKLPQSPKIIDAHPNKILQNPSQCLQMDFGQVFKQKQESESELK